MSQQIPFAPQNPYIYTPQYTPSVPAAHSHGTLLKVSCGLIILAAIGILIWWIVTTKTEAKVTTIPLGITIVSDNKNIAAIPTELPINCSTNNCSTTLVTPINTVTKVPTGLTSIVTTGSSAIVSTPQERCTRLSGYRLPGAGYKSGTVDEQIQPGYGGVLPDSETCFAACQADTDCVQYTFDTSQKKCYKSSKKYAYTTSDQLPGWDSGVC